MARTHDRQKAIALRQMGKTYNEIKVELGLPKSTLSDWLRNYPLNEEQMILLQENRKRNKYLGIEKTILVKQKKRERRLDSFYEAEKKQWLPLSDREIALAGLFLYWGEGRKSLKGSLSLNNTDPKVVKFTLFWLSNVLKVPREKIKVELHLYNDMDIQKEIGFWSMELRLPLSQFLNPYIKQSKRIEIDHKGFGHGTCGLVVNNIRLKEKVIMAINAISDYYSQKIAMMI